MVGIDFRPYEEGDVYRIRIRNGDAMGELISIPDGEKWTMTKDGEPIACAGFMTVEDGIAVLWSFISDEARGHGLMLVRFARRLINGALADEFHRIQCMVRADRPEYIRFARAIGLEPEGLLRKATKDKIDLWSMAKVGE